METWINDKIEFWVANSDSIEDEERELLLSKLHKRKDIMLAGNISYQSSHLTSYPKLYEKLINYDKTSVFFDLLLAYIFEYKLLVVIDNKTCNPNPTIHAIAITMNTNL